MSLADDIAGALLSSDPTLAAGLALRAVARRAGLTGRVSLAEVREALEVAGLPKDTPITFYDPTAAHFPDWAGGREDTPPPPEKMP